MKKIYLFFLIFPIIFVACKKNKDAEISRFSIQNENIVPSSTTMELSCDVVCSATIKDLYLQYGTKADLSKCEEVRMKNNGNNRYSVTINSLTANTTYYVRYLAVNSYSSMMSKEITKFKTLTKSEPDDFEPEYVDLGLPSGLKWATCNVGATTPEEYGDYFAWGEVEPKENYDWSTYKYGKASDQLTKYCNDSKYGKDGFTDNKTVLDPEDDAATANWGGLWRMPTKAEQDELREQCTWTWTTQNGVNGYKVVGTNGNFIFLPAAGLRYNTMLGYVGSDAYYWSSVLGISRHDGACIVYFTYKSVEWYDDGIRHNGFSVRPVYGAKGDNPEKNQYTIKVSANNSSYGSVSGGGTYEEGTQVTLTATANSGYKFTEWNDGNTDNPRVITVTQDESYTAYFEVEATMNAGHEYVDLGLPSGLQWATCNVGATTPEEYGDYFAWGEVEPKEIYNWSTYKYCVDNYDNLTKYCNMSSYGKNGFTDNKTILDSEDDAATANWGGVWRMPTHDEFTELREKCTWTWIMQNGVNGYKVTGTNGNSIFLPAAGGIHDGRLFQAGSGGRYWSNSLFTDDPYLTDNPYHAYYVFFESGYVDYSKDNRYYGFSVRPVYAKYSYTITVSANSSSYGTVSGGGTYEEGTQVTLTATANSGYKFTEWNDGNTDNPRVITVTQDESYTAYFEKEEMPMHEGHEYVDLGLPSGLKWATCNVGANSPEEYGDYFAWGEVEPKETYDWSTYKYGTGLDQLTKYCHNSSYGKNGFMDNKTVLEPEDDAAHVNWGGTWRMPTKAEQVELLNNCTWDWITQNGVKGYKVIGPNGNSIFLPAAGYMGEGTIGTGLGSYYWSSSRYAGDPYYAYSVLLVSNGVDWSYYDRYYGFSVRPVCK